MRTVVTIVTSLLLTAASCSAKQPPKAPKAPKVADKSFLSIAALTSASVLADSYSTTWIREHWQSVPKSNTHTLPCMVESGEPYFYGKEPTKARSYEVGAAKIAFALGTSYLLKRKRPVFAQKGLWATPMLEMAGESIHGFTVNMQNCPH